MHVMSALCHLPGHPAEKRMESVAGRNSSEVGAIAEDLGNPVKTSGPFSTKSLSLKLALMVPSGLVSNSDWRRAT